MMVLAIVLGNGHLRSQDDHQSETTTNPKATEDVRSLKTMMLKTASAIESVRIGYRGNYSEPRLTELNAFYRVRLSAKAPHFLMYDAAHGHDFLDWQLDPFRQVAYVQKNHYYNYYPLDRMFFWQELAPTAPNPGSLQLPFYFRATGIWPAWQRKAPQRDNLAYVLRDIALSSESHTHLRPKLEKISGRWCHVLEHPGSDTLWLDAERGACLLQRELSDKKTGRVLQRFRLLKQEQPAPGIWMPTIIENTVSNIVHDRKTNKESKQEKTSIIGINICEVNNVPDSHFHFPIPDGALEMDEADRKARSVQVTAGGLDQFDAITNWVIGDRISTITTNNTFLKRSTPPPFDPFKMLFPVVLVTVLIGICELFLFTQRAAVVDRSNAEEELQLIHEAPK